MTSSGKSPTDSEPPTEPAASAGPADRTRGEPTLPADPAEPLRPVEPPQAATPTAPRPADPSPRSTAATGPAADPPTRAAAATGDPAAGRAAGSPGATPATGTAAADPPPRAGAGNGGAARAAGVSGAALGASGAAEPPLRSGGRRWFGSPFWRTPGGIAAVVLLVLVAILVVVELTNRAGRDDVASAADHAVSVPLDGRQQADFVLLSGATSVTVRTVDLGDRMLVASTPLDAGIVPRLVDGTGRLELHLLSSGTSGPSAVDIQLNSAVRWGVRLDGGSVQQTLDLTGGRLTGVDLVAGATRIDLSLPRPAGTVPIRLTGGATAFSVHTPADAPTRARVGSGAGSVRVNGVERTGVAAGEVFAPVGWDQATDRYDIDVSAGVSVLTLDRR